MNVLRETIGPFTTALAQGNAVAATIKTIDHVPLSEFEQIRVRILVATQPNSAGAGTLDFYLQRPVSGTLPDPTVDADWEDFVAFTQLAKLTAMDRVVTIPIDPPQTATWAALGSTDRARAIYALASGSILAGGWGDMIRLGNKIATADLSVAGIYSVHLTGIRGD